MVQLLLHHLSDQQFQVHLCGPVHLEVLLIQWLPLGQAGREDLEHP